MLFEAFKRLSYEYWSVDYSLPVFPGCHAHSVCTMIRNFIVQSVPLSDYPHTPTHNGGT